MKTKSLTSKIIKAVKGVMQSEHKPGDNPNWLTVRNEADAAKFYINGHIGSSWYDDSGTSSKQFRAEFDKVPKGKKIHVHINSEGGSVGDALEIYNTEQERKEDVTTFNDGYALSSGSIILCGGGRSITPHSSITMIHEPWSMTVGDESDHLKAAEMLAKHGDTLAQIYARKTGKSVDDMRQAMRDESWFTGQEAAEYGLADGMDGDAECPSCGHEQCGDCTMEDGQITCSECGESADSEEWEDDEEPEPDETAARAHFADLDTTRFRNIPVHVLNMISPGAVAGGAVKKTGAVASGNNAQNQMNKKAILALLKARGVELAADASEETILAELNKLVDSKPKAETDAILDELKKLVKEEPSGNADIIDLRAQLKTEKEAREAERKIRVTAEVKRLSENRIANDKLGWWIDLAMKDEAGTMAQINALPVVRPGGDPMRPSVEILDTRIEEIKKMRTAAERYRATKNEWSGLIADAIVKDSRQRNAAMAANTYSATLVTNFLIDGSVTQLQNRWAPLKAFSRDFTTDRYKPRATGQLKFVTAGGTAQKNASNFESGDSTVAPVSIAVDQYTVSFHVTNDELNSGLRMENLIDINVAQIANEILLVAFTPVSKANFTAAPLIRASGAFSWADMATAWGLIKKSPIKNAILDGEYMGRLVNQPGFFQKTDTESGVGEGWRSFGWDGVFLNTQWAGTPAGDNIHGIFMNPQGLGAIAGLPLTPPTIPGATLMESSFEVPEVSMSIATYQWFSLSTRTFWMSYDLMFGSQVLDPTAGQLLTSA